MDCPLFGSAKEFNKNNLPTISDVCLQYLVLKEKIKRETNSAIDPKRREVNKQVYDLLILIWGEANIKTQKQLTVMTRLERLRNKYIEISRFHQHPDKIKPLKVTAFKNEGKSLFDIRECKNLPIKCQCENCTILPQKLKSFIIDQLGPRNQTIP